MTRDMEPDLIHQNFLSRQSKFTELIQYFVEISAPHVTGEVLEMIKEYYSGVIDSKRDRARVKDIAGLLRILEKRDVLRYDSIEPLKQIAIQCIRDTILIQRLDCYEAEIKNERPLLPINHYKYSGEYLVSTSVTECLLSDRDYGERNDDHEIFNLRVEEAQGFDVNEEQLSTHSSVPENRCSGSKCFCHSHHSHYFLFMKSSRWRERFSLITVLPLFILIIMGAIYIQYPYRQSSAVWGSSQGSSSQSHAVNFYPNETPLPVFPYTALSPPTSGRPISAVQEQVFQRLSENLGKYWRDVARFLNVKEYEIDAIDEKTHLSPKERAYEALLIFISRCNYNWKVKIQQALEKARRKDLAEMINEIMLSDNVQ
ncbi:uncharacterized protein LOC135166610 isoform X1 [Diachasmimorpha longicaudata]|uniref:uncharacterized protein LOC135166610 isoform X1 n=1 Tax=Diachasmimorpha longicaudata TaxID=58733 RepID=UPI0030B8D8EE